MDKKSENRISNTLGINPKPEEKVEATKKVVKEKKKDKNTSLSKRPTGTTSKKGKAIVTRDDDHDKDYDTVRSNLKSLADEGKSAIDKILEIANASESPRAFEVASQLIKTVADINKDMISLHKQMKELNQDEINIKQTNNSIFVGSTKGLQELINTSRSASRLIENTADDYDVIDVETE